MFLKVKDSEATCQKQQGRINYIQNLYWFSHNLRLSLIPTLIRFLLM